MQSRSHCGGFEFMPKPSAKYYEDLPNKIGNVLTPEQYKVRGGCRVQGRPFLEQYKVRGGCRCRGGPSLSSTR